MLEYNKQKAQADWLAIMRAVKKAGDNGQAMIIGMETKTGVRIIVTSRQNLADQVNEIVKKEKF